MTILVACLGIALLCVIVAALLIGQSATAWKSKADSHLETAEHYRERFVEVSEEGSKWRAFGRLYALSGPNGSCVACGHRVHADGCAFVELDEAT